MSEKSYFNVLILGMIVNLIISFGVYLYLVLSLLVTLGVMSLTVAESCWIATAVLTGVVVLMVIIIGIRSFIKDGADVNNIPKDLNDIIKDL